MHKNFITFYFMAALFSMTALADVTPIAGSNPIDMLRQQQQQPNEKPKAYDEIELPDPNNPEAVREFFKKRLEVAVKMETSEPIDLSTPSAIGVVYSPEYYKREQEKNKPLFQKMYEKALASLHGDEQKNDDTDNTDAPRNETIETATRFFRLVDQNIRDEQTEPQIPTVSVPLPSGRRILAPALEHIPYWLSYIDIQANGFLKIEDTITLVANGKKFAQGLTRVFPKYARNSQKIELILNSVTINDHEIPYILEEIGSQIILKPKYNQKLDPGVYTYKFSYMLTNKLYRINNDRVLMRWNLTGVPLNVFITSINTIISVPTGSSFLGVETFIGENNKFSNTRMNTYRLSENVAAFSANTPMLNGENVEVIALLDQKIFFPDFDKNFALLLTNWGNIIYATLGLITIVVSFLLSLLTLKKNVKTNKFSPSYNGAVMRSILIGKYDRIAFISGLLDIYRKDALDITEENGRLFLEKKQGLKTPKLNKFERKVLGILFAKKTQKFEVNNINNTRLKRAYRILEKSVTAQLKKMRIIQNIGYLIFSVLMLLATLIFIAAISTNIAQSLIILFSTTSLYAFYIWIFRHKFKRWYVAIPIKVLALLSLLLIWIFSSIYVGQITSIIIALCVYLIYMFIDIFSEHNNFINEAKETISHYKEYLVNNSESINLSNAFLMQQSNIYALSISEYFPQNISNQKRYKLDIAEDLRRSLIGII